MRLPDELQAQIVEHAQREAPKECCGWVGVRDGVAVIVHAAENLRDSTFSFEIGGKDALVPVHWEAEGVDLGGIYHSHTRSEPFPSQTDVNFAAHWPGVEWLIVGLAGDEPEVRSFLIDEAGEITEVDV